MSTFIIVSFLTESNMIESDYNIIPLITDVM